MDGVISLGVGEPDFRTPWQIRKAGINSLEKGKTKYTSNWGIAQLRSAVSDYVKRKYSLDYKPDEEILITVGGSEAIDACIRALVSPGDEVIIPQPSYVCYEPITRLAGGVPVIIETRAEDDFKVTREQLEKALSPRTKLLILPYPCNPTGAVMEKEDLEELARVLKNTNVAVLSDEIYAELTFGGKKACFPCKYRRYVGKNRYGKRLFKGVFNDGWRLGFACGPREIMDQITKIHQFAIMCAPTTSQYAAIEALKNCDGEVERMVHEYDMRRRMMVAGFNEIGLTCREPKGAFYTFPSVKSTGLSSDEFCERLLYQQKSCGSTRNRVRGQRRGLYKSVVLLFRRAYKRGNFKNRRIFKGTVKSTNCRSVTLRQFVYGDEYGGSVTEGSRHGI